MHCMKCLCVFLSIALFDKIIAKPNKNGVATLTPADFKNAEHVKEGSGEKNFDRIYKQNFFQGDMVDPDFKNFDTANTPDGVGANAQKDSGFLWFEGKVHYTISTAYDEGQRAVIAKAMKAFHDHTCIKFVPRKKEKNYIHIEPTGKGCYSYVGKVRGNQTVSLDTDGCMQTGTVIHELMHAVGFFHEQARNDRDDYVRVNWDNIEKKSHPQFKKLSLTEITHLETNYDYGSVMHYHKTAFSKNGKPSIEPIKNTKGVNIGWANTFSKNDIVKINRLYGCEGGGKPKPPTTTAKSPQTTTTESDKPTTTEDPSCYQRPDLEQRCKWRSGKGDCTEKVCADDPKPKNLKKCKKWKVRKTEDEIFDHCVATTYCKKTCGVKDCTLQKDCFNTQF